MIANNSNRRSVMDIIDKHSRSVMEVRFSNVSSWGRDRGR